MDLLGMSTVAEIRQLPNFNLAIGDFLAVFAIARQIQVIGRVYQLRPGRYVFLEEMHAHPVIAVGALNNPWTIQLSPDLRFVNEIQRRPPSQKEEYCILERQVMTLVILAPERAA
jgi:hypothetical protein